MSLQPSDLRARKERLAAAIAEKRKREERVYYEQNLSAFVREAWSAIDSSQFQDSWALDALCEHLSAVTRGHIKRLLINFPPRCGKSNVSSIAWPAWVWAQSDTSFIAGPNVRFLCGSYNHTLSLQHSNSCRRLLTSPFYQHYWGDRFSLMSDQNAKSQYDTDKGGRRIATSVGGSLIGIGGDIICFPAWETVSTEHGLIPIGDLVASRKPVSVWSVDIDTGAVSLKPIVGWHKNSGRALVCVTLDDGAQVTCTADHKIWTRRGWKQAKDLTCGDVLPRFARQDVADRGSVDAVLAGQCAAAEWRRPYLSNDLLCQFRVAVVRADAYISRLTEWLRDISPRQALSNLANRIPSNAVPFCKNSGGFVRLSDLNCLRLGENGSGAALMHRERAVPFGVSDVLGSGPVFQVVEPTIGRIAVFVAHLLASRRRTFERPEHDLVNPKLGRASILTRIKTRVAFGRRCLDWFRLEQADLAIRLNDTAFQRSDQTVTGNFVVRETGDRKPVLVEHLGHVDETFCLSVADNNTFCVGPGNILVSNCVDDPHNTEAVESEAERETVLRWWRELSSTRLNDPKQSALVVIMQRLHEKDVSGVILESKRDWTHLMLPMRYVENRHCVTRLAPGVTWQDPRADSGEELLWPERYGEPEVQALEEELGPYMASGRLQQRPTPAGGGIFKEEWWEPYDLPLGKTFTHPFEIRVASLDPAFTAKQENDPSGFTAWGAYANPQRHSKVLLLQAWNKWLELHGQEVEREPGEKPEAYIHRAKPHWGLVEWVAYECRRLKIDILLIEDKASGHSVAQEMRRLYGDEKWSVLLVNPGSLDKRARAYTVQHLFADRMIEAPGSITDPATGSFQFRDWAQTMITEASQFRGLPGDEDNLIDSMTQALKFMRDRGYAVRKGEGQALEDARARRNIGAKREAIYPV